MFIVLNKFKIVSYLISLGAVIMIFSTTFMFEKDNDTVETYSSNMNNIQEENALYDE